MRYLLLTRGMPLCGKTTWIQQYNLESYVLNPKYFQSLLHAPMLDDFGNFTQPKQNDKLAYQMLFTALQSRMERGEFIIIEDLHILKSYCSNYKRMAKHYAYEIFVVDFTQVPFETICERNKAQKDNNYTEEELKTLYDMMMNEEIPIKCKTITPDKIATMLDTEAYNLNGYKIIHHIGDIHGSYHVLKQYFKEMKNDEFYIFLGDYIDRGFQNYEVLQFLLQIMDKKNVCLLEGNHEKWLWEWANNREVEAKEFRFSTQRELEQKGLNKDDIKKLYLALKPYFFYRFHDKRVICTHGGISNIPKHLILLSAAQSIHGVGSYLNASSIAQAFAQNTPENFYQVFGHRNKTGLPIKLNDKNFILESQVEFGGYLRILQLNQHGFIDKSLKNSIFITKEEKEAQRKLQKFFDYLLHNKQFTLKNNGDFVGIEYPTIKRPKDLAGLIHAFYPCVIDIKKWQFVARGYHLNQDKTLHFNASKEGVLKHISFPLHITQKLFGKQFIISFYNNGFYVFKDSILESKMPTFLKDKEKQKKLTEYFKNKSYSLLCIQTNQHEVYLLDVFPNQTDTQALSPSEREKIADILHIKTKEILLTINNEAELHAFIRAINKYNMCIALDKTFQVNNTQSQQELHTNKAKLDSNTFDKHNSSMKTYNMQYENVENTPSHMEYKVLESIPLKLHILESNSLNISPNVSFSGFCMVDNEANLYEIQTLYRHEMQVLAELIKVWRIRDEIAPLSWVKTPLRFAFMNWLSAFAAQNDWKNISISWIQNAFIHDLVTNHINATQIPYHFTIE